MATGGKSKNNPNYMQGAGYMRENSIRNAATQSKLDHRSPLGQLKAENAVRARSSGSTSSQRESGGGRSANLGNGNHVRVIKHGKDVKFK